MSGGAGAWVRKVLDNPLPLGAGALVVGLLHLRRITRREVVVQEEEEVALAADWQVAAYQLLPLRLVSRLWGGLHELTLPPALRGVVLGTYARCSSSTSSSSTTSPPSFTASPPFSTTFSSTTSPPLHPRTFGCNMEEAEECDLSSYPSLGQLFRRRLRPGCRPLATAPLVAPADGALLTCGRLQQGDRVEQVKGVTYSLRAFLGEGWGRGVEVAGPAPAPMVLHQAVIYLAPGDYHCFHAPADWTITQRRHFPGLGFVHPAT